MAWFIKKIRFDAMSFMLIVCIALIHVSLVKFIGGMVTIVPNYKGPVAQRITRLTTDQKIPGSNPGRLVIIFVTKKNHGRAT